jgi:hypothetical protein
VVAIWVIDRHIKVIKPMKTTSKALHFYQISVLFSDKEFPGGKPTIVN